MTPTIRFATPIDDEPDFVLIPDGNYVFVIDSVDNDKTKLKEGQSEDDRKQLVKVLFKVAEDGDYFGLPLKQSYSVEDGAGRKRFRQLYMAVNPTHEGSIEEIQSEDLIGKKLYISVTSRTLPAREGQTEGLVINDIERGGYAPYDANATPPAKPAGKKPSAGKPPVKGTKPIKKNETAAGEVADTEDW